MDEIERLLELGLKDLEAGYPQYAREYFEKVLALDANNQEAIDALARIKDMLTPKANLGSEERPVRPVPRWGGGGVLLNTCPACGSRSIQQERGDLLEKAGGCLLAVSGLLFLVVFLPLGVILLLLSFVSVRGGKKMECLECGAIWKV